MGTGNEVIGTWTVLEFSHDKSFQTKGGVRNRFYWKIECLNCGIKKMAQKSNLTQKCQNCWGRKKGESGLLVLLGVYKRNSLRGKREFDLPLDEFRELTSGNCHYCGSCPKLIRRGGKRTAKTTWGNYVYNGIDRIDNSIGYVKSNCVSCCKICNRGKNSMPYDEFMDYIEGIERNGEKKRARQVV